MTRRKVMTQNKFIFRLRLFLYLSGVEVLFSGMLSALIASKQGMDSTLVVSALAAFGGLIGLFISTLLHKKSSLENKIIDIFKGIDGRLFPLIVILFLAAFFFILQPPVSIVLAVSPLLICTWLIGLEFQLLFERSQESNLGKDANLSDQKEKMLGIISIFLVYDFLLLPSHIHSWLDGYPWDSPPEFIFAAFVLPLTFIVYWKVFAKRFFVFFLASLFIAKFMLFVFLPQSGLGVHAFTSEDAASTDQWERSYYTFSDPGYTQVINRPYYTFREFPVEWINNRFGFERNKFWLKLELSGYIKLRENEKLVFVVQGASQMQGEFLDLSTQVTTPLVFITQAKDADEALYASIPESHEVEIQSTILFDMIGNMRLEPLLLYPDGSTISLFEFPRVWTSPKGVNLTASQVRMFGFILNVLGLIFAGLILYGLMAETYKLWQAGEISLLDLYLALSGLPLFFVTFLIHKKYLNILALSVILVFLIIKFIDRFLYQRRFSWKVFLFSIGVVLLCLFLALDTYDLRVITSFPPSQDGLEYQTLAHNIYVNLDIFLKDTPPRAYKVLFPYIVGLLHVLFGHSAAAQFFINTWYAILSGALIIEITKQLGLNDWVAFSIAVYYLSILFLPSLYIFYFRFGLIEPLATTLLLLTYYLALKRQRLGMFISGALTVLLRLDYLGMAFTAILLTSMPMLGSLKNAWTQFFDWSKTNWRLLTTYLTSICLPILLVVLGYFLFIPNYYLNASDTEQTSFKSILEGLMRVIAGGTFKDLRELYVDFQLVDVLLISTPLVIGFVFVVLFAFVRTGLFKNIDLRLSLLALSLLPAYILVRPAAYFPRFSLPLLPLDLILISLFLHFWFQSRSIELKH